LNITLRSENFRASPIPGLSNVTRTRFETRCQRNLPESQSFRLLISKPGKQAIEVSKRHGKRFAVSFRDSERRKLNVYREIHRPVEATVFELLNEKWILFLNCNWSCDVRFERTSRWRERKASCERHPQLTISGKSPQNRAFRDSE
jgi:hypothetical protein